MTKKITLTLIILFTLQLKAQNTTSFLNDYYKLNLKLGGGYFYGAKTSNLPNDGTIKYSFKNYLAPSFALHYDFFKKEKLNFKVGVSAFTLREKEYFYINENENISDEGNYETISNDWQFNIPFTLEYINDFYNSKISFNASYIIGYQNYYHTETNYTVGSYITGEEIVFKGKHSRGENVWHPSAQIGVGMYFPFKKWMLRTNLYYNIMLEKMFEGNYEWKGFENHPNITGKYSFTGNSFGIEFSIYLANKKRKSKIE